MYAKYIAFLSIAPQKNTHIGPLTTCANFYGSLRYSEGLLLSNHVITYAHLYTKCPVIHVIVTSGNSKTFTEKPKEFDMCKNTCGVATCLCESHKGLHVKYVVTWCHM